jgi:hypothetical protein
MPQAIRKHLSYANVAATMALVFALTGGAVAATGHGGGSAPAKATASVGRTGSNLTLATIAKKKKAAPKSTRGPAGPKGATGATGATGPAGATGPVGPTGPVGGAGPAGGNGPSGESVTVAAAAAGECKSGAGAKLSNASGSVPVCNGEKGAKGSAGEPWSPNSELPAGATETGVWYAENSSGVANAPFSFTVPLGAPLSASSVHFINAAGEEVPSFGGTPQASAECHGTAVQPTAEPGNLCVYLSNSTKNAESASEGISDPTTGSAGAARSGAFITVGVEHTGGTADGTWAVTG